MHHHPAAIYRLITSLAPLQTTRNATIECRLNKDGAFVLIYLPLPSIQLIYFVSHIVDGDAVSMETVYLNRAQINIESIVNAFLWQFFRAIATSSFFLFIFLIDCRYCPPVSFPLWSPFIIAD